MNAVSFSNSGVQDIIHDVTQVNFNMVLPGSLDGIARLTGEGGVVIQNDGPHLIHFAGNAFLLDEEEDVSAWSIHVNGQHVMGSLSYGKHSPALRNGSGGRSMLVPLNRGDVVKVNVTNQLIKEMIVKARGSVLTIQRL